MQYVNDKNNALIVKKSIILSNNSYYRKCNLVCKKQTDVFSFIAISNSSVVIIGSFCVYLLSNQRPNANRSQIKIKE
jgi:hypothetical protein